MENNDVALLMAQKVILEKHSCLVDLARTGAEALEKLQRNRYDLIFMDVGLPDIDGLTVTAKIREANGINKTAPIFALTIQDDNTHHNQAIWVGMTGFLSKPLTAEKCEIAFKYISTSSNE